MEIALAILGIVLICIAFVGCFVPVLPGPPIAYAVLLIAQLGPNAPFSLQFMIIMAVIVGCITIIDYMIPAFGAKKWGGSRYGIIGAILGVLLGIFILPPFGFIIFPFVGAIAGELLNGTKSDRALRAALGTLVGLLFGSLLKFSVTLIIAYYFFTNL